MRKLLILSFIIVLVGIDCKKESQTTGPAPLLKTKWVLTQIQATGKGAISYFPTDAPAKISIVFTDSENALTFKGICNIGGGTYSYSSDSGDIKINGIVTTKIACLYVEWESITIQNLDNAYGYAINGDNLTIYSASTYNLSFTRE